MSGVAALVLATACLHAGWNTAAKSVGDRWVSSALIGSVYTVVGIVAVLVLPVPDVRRVAVRRRFGRAAGRAPAAAHHRLRVRRHEPPVPARTWHVAVAGHDVRGRRPA